MGRSTLIPRLGDGTGTVRGTKFHADDAACVLANTSARMRTFIADKADSIAGTALVGSAPLLNSNWSTKVRVNQEHHTDSMTSHAQPERV